MSERTHGCWLDLCKGQTPDRCVLETGEPVENCCVAIELRADGKTQWACEYWKPLNPEHPSEVEALRAEIARLRLTDAERDDLRVWLTECLRQASTATEGCNEELADRWLGRSRRAAAMLERLG